MVVWSVWSRMSSIWSSMVRSIGIGSVGSCMGMRDVAMGSVGQNRLRGLQVLSDGQGDAKANQLEGIKIRIKF